MILGHHIFSSASTIMASLHLFLCVTVHSCWSLLGCLRLHLLLWWLVHKGTLYHHKVPKGHQDSSALNIEWETFNLSPYQWDLRDQVSFPGPFKPISLSQWLRGENECEELQDLFHFPKPCSPGKLWFFLPWTYDSSSTMNLTLRNSTQRPLSGSLILFLFFYLWDFNPI